MEFLSLKLLQKRTRELLLCMVGKATAWPCVLAVPLWIQLPTHRLGKATVVVPGAWASATCAGDWAKHMHPGFA